MDADERLTVADFFAGAGGFSEGFSQKGFDIVFGLDNWEPATDSLELNHPGIETVTMDITEIETGEDIDEIIPDVDVIIGGPPCVSFSHSNKAGKADKTEGLNLIECFLRIVAWKKEHGGLKYWAMENVPNTKKHIKDVYTWDELQLPGDGPDLEVPKKPIHNSADYGTPQTRRRMIIGNYPDVERTHYEDPAEGQDSWVTMADVFDRLHDPLEDPDVDTIQDPCYPIELSKGALTDHFYDSRVEEYRWRRAKKLKEDHGFMGKMDFPERLDRPSRTVMATRSASTRESMLFGIDEDGDGGYEEYRLPTVREIACFSSFPITYEFEASTEAKKYRLVGNAVPPKLSGAIAEAIAEAEGMDIPDEPVVPGNKEPSLDLTGREREFRKPRKRRDDSKYARHVPYIKERSFRAELDNKESDFQEDRVVWSTVLHKGQGRRAIETEATREEVEALKGSKVVLEKMGADPSLADIDWEEFEAALEDVFQGLLPTPEDFQEYYVYRGREDRMDDIIGPNEALWAVKKLIDGLSHGPELGFVEESKNFGEGGFLPKDAYEGIEAVNDGAIDLDVDRIPVRIVASLIGCRYITDRVMGERGGTADGPEPAMDGDETTMEHYPSPNSLG